MRMANPTSTLKLTNPSNRRHRTPGGLVGIDWGGWDVGPPIIIIIIIIIIITSYTQYPVTDHRRSSHHFLTLAHPTKHTQARPCCSARARTLLARIDHSLEPGSHPTCCVFVRAGLWLVPDPLRSIETSSGTKQPWRPRPPCP